MKKYSLVIAALTAWTIITTAPSTAGGPVAVAETMVGMREGTAALNKIIGVDTRRVKWCVGFIRAVFRRSGRRLGVDTLAVSGLDSSRVGPIVSRPSRGDLAFRRYSHVELVTGVRGRTVCTISGNSKNRVLKRCADRGKFRRFRRP
jgi:hypothetical protein